MIKTILLTGTESSLDFLVSNRITILIVYIIFVMSIIAWLHYTRKTTISADKAYNSILDKLRYETSSILYHEKDNIHDIKNTIPILLHHKSECAKNTIPYRSVHDKLIEEIEYIGNLVDKPIMIDKEKLQKTADFCSKLHHIENNLKALLGLLTLWISKLFTK